MGVLVDSDYVLIRQGAEQPRIVLQYSEGPAVLSSAKKVRPAQLDVGQGRV